MVERKGDGIDSKLAPLRPLQRVLLNNGMPRCFYSGYIYMHTHIYIYTHMSICIYTLRFQNRRIRRVDLNTRGLNLKPGVCDSGNFMAVDKVP